jgi:succinyl-CoA synthetase beta subunit
LVGQLRFPGLEARDLLPHRRKLLLERRHLLPGGGKVVLRRRGLLAQPVALLRRLAYRSRQRLPLPGQPFGLRPEPRDLGPQVVRSTGKAPLLVELALQRRHLGLECIALRGAGHEDVHEDEKDHRGRERDVENRPASGTRASVRHGCFLPPLRDLLWTLRTHRAPGGFRLAPAGRAVESARAPRSGRSGTTRRDRVGRSVITLFSLVITKGGFSAPNRSALRKVIYREGALCIEHAKRKQEGPALNIHEYQAKALLRDYGAPVSDGRVVLRAEEAKTAAGALDGPLWVVKAQIHAGGRGKGSFKEADAGEKGGVRLAKSVEEAAEEAKRMLGRTLVTKQTGPAGKQVNRIYIEDGSGIERELYLALLVDRQTSRVSFVASTEGGMDIEEVAHSTPEKILTFSVDPATGYQAFHGRRIAFSLGLEGGQVKQCVALMGILYKLFVDKDMEMLEINPLIVTDKGDLKCLDAKMGFDGNAIYRHQDIAALRDETEEDPKELQASKYDLNYIALDGEIGCMVNGAGLAMATMDIIKLYGAEPANFLDVGGGATKEKVTEAFKIITSDPNVKGILVNIFGGIMRCDIIAEGIIAAVKEVGLQVPLVVRLEGTNVDLGKKIVAESGLNVIAADNLSDAAEKIVKAVKG